MQLDPRAGAGECGRYARTMDGGSRRELKAEGRYAGWRGAPRSWAFRRAGATHRSAQERRIREVI